MWNLGYLKKFDKFCSFHSFINLSETLLTGGSSSQPKFDRIQLNPWNSAWTACVLGKNRHLPQWQPLPVPPTPQLTSAPYNWSLGKWSVIDSTPFWTFLMGWTSFCRRGGLPLLHFMYIPFHESVPYHVPLYFLIIHY